MGYYQLILIQLAGFILYALVGVIGVKANIFNEKSLGVISGLIIHITMPIMLFHDIINGSTKEEIANTLPVLYLTALMFFIVYFICLGLNRIFHFTGNKANVYLAATMFGNVGFMGIPIMSALFPEKGMVYVSLMTIIDQFLFWTLGAKLTSPIEKEEKEKKLKSTLKKIFNEATIAIILAFICVLFGVHLPGILDTPLGKIGSVTSYLAIIYLGGLFCYADIPSAFRKIEFYVAILVRMVVFPIIFFLGIRMIPGVTNEVSLVMAILSAMPAMSSVAMLAKAQGSEGEYAAGEVFLTTLFSVVTLPVVCYIVTEIF